MLLRPLPTLDEPFEISKPTRALQKRTNERIREWNEKLEAYAADLATFEGLDPAESSVGELEAVGDEFPRRRLAIVHQELQIRRAMAEYFAVRNVDADNAYMASITSFEKVESDLRTKLLELGYVEGMIPNSNAPSLIPMIWQHHPAHFYARNERDRLMGCRQSPHEAPNRERIEVIGGELIAMREKIVATARS